MARRRYVSIKEVAARAGVSFQTASKVLNGGDVRVSTETEERILAAAAELGYRPNTIARSGSSAAGCTATRTRCARRAWSRARTWWPRATGRRKGSPLTYISHKALTGIARIREPKGNV